MDDSFIKRATRVTSFNLMPSDFTSLRYKKEIQHIFHLHFFPNFNLDSTLKNLKTDKDNFNRLVNKLKQEDKELFLKLHSYNLKGVGPGEATLFFLINEAHLGGGSSAGVDLVDGSSKYEVKAVKVNTTGIKMASDFKLGGTVDLSDIMIDLNSLREKSNVGGSKTEISGERIGQIKNKYPEQYKLIEDEYSKRAYNYFKGHKTIFMYNSGPNIGEIAAIKEIKKNEIFIERVTSGTVKPKIKL